jgi:DnaJ-class molecular chaperone
MPIVGAKKCKACSGTGVRSVGGLCYPCGGSGFQQKQNMEESRVAYSKPVKPRKPFAKPKRS